MRRAVGLQGGEEESRSQGGLINPTQRMFVLVLPRKLVSCAQWPSDYSAVSQSRLPLAFLFTFIDCTTYDAG